MYKITNLILLGTIFSASTLKASESERFSPQAIQSPIQSLRQIKKVRLEKLPTKAQKIVEKFPPSLKEEFLNLSQQMVKTLFTFKYFLTEEELRVDLVRQGLEQGHINNEFLSKNLLIELLSHYESHGALEEYYTYLTTAEPPTISKTTKKKGKKGKKSKRSTQRQQQRKAVQSYQDKANEVLEKAFYKKNSPWAIELYKRKFDEAPDKLSGRELSNLAQFSEIDCQKKRILHLLKDKHLLHTLKEIEDKFNLAKRNYEKDKANKEDFVEDFIKLYYEEDKKNYTYNNFILLVHFFETLYEKHQDSSLEKFYLNALITTLDYSLKLGCWNSFKVYKSYCGLFIKKFSSESENVNSEEIYYKKLLDIVTVCEAGNHNFLHLYYELFTDAYKILEKSLEINHNIPPYISNLLKKSTQKLLENGCTNMTIFSKNFSEVFSEIFYSLSGLFEDVGRNYEAALYRITAIDLGNNIEHFKAASLLLSRSTHYSDSAIKTAIRLAKTAAKLGNTKGYTLVGSLFSAQENNENAPHKALKYYLKAIENNENEAKDYIFHLMMRHNIGDKKQGLEWLKEVAETEFASASTLHELGFYYFDGIENLLDPNLELCENYFLRAFSKGYHFSSIGLATLYFKKNDIHKSFLFLKIAQSLGIPQATDYLEKCISLLANPTSEAEEKLGNNFLEVGQPSFLLLQKQKIPFSISSESDEEEEKDEDTSSLKSELDEAKDKESIEQALKEFEEQRSKDRQQKENAKQSSKEKWQNLAILKQNNDSQPQFTICSDDFKADKIIYQNLASNRAVNSADLIRLVNHSVFQNSIDIISTKSGMTFIFRNGSKIDAVGLHKKHNKSYKGEDRTFLRNFYTKITAVYNIK